MLQVLGGALVAACFWSMDRTGFSFIAGSRPITVVPATSAAQAAQAAQVAQVAEPSGLAVANGLSPSPHDQRHRARARNSTGIPAIDSARVISAG